MTDAHDDSKDRAASSGGRVTDGVANVALDGVKYDARTLLRALLCSVVWSSPA